MQWKLWHHFISPCCCEWLWEAVYSCTQLCFPLRQTHIDYEVFQITSNVEKLTKKNCLVSRGQQGDIKWIWQVTVAKHHSLYSAGGCCESQVFTWIQKPTEQPDRREHHHRWIMILLTQTSEHQIIKSSENIFEGITCWLVLALQSSLDDYQWEQGRKTEEIFVKWTFNVQLGSTNRRS